MTDIRPTDPSTLTTEQLKREIATLQTLMNEKFSSVEHILKLMENHRLEQKQDNQETLIATLSAAKEAVVKSEIGMNEQIKQLNLTLVAAVESLRRENTDLKERINRLAG